MRRAWIGLITGAGLVALAEISAGPAARSFAVDALDLVRQPEASARSVAAETGFDPRGVDRAGVGSPLAAQLESASRPFDALIGDEALPGWLLAVAGLTVAVLCRETLDLAPVVLGGVGVAQLLRITATQGFGFPDVAFLFGGIGFLASTAGWFLVDDRLRDRLRRISAAAFVLLTLPELTSRLRAPTAGPVAVMSLAAVLWPIVGSWSLASALPVVGLGGGPVTGYPIVFAVGAVIWLGPDRLARMVRTKGRRVVDLLSDRFWPVGPNLSRVIWASMNGSQGIQRWTGRRTDTDRFGENRSSNETFRGNEQDEPASTRDAGVPCPGVDERERANEEDCGERSIGQQRPREKQPDPALDPLEPLDSRSSELAASEPLAEHPDGGFSAPTSLRVFLGHEVETGHPLFWEPWSEDETTLANQHFLLTGNSGAGKTQMLKSCLQDLAYHGVPSIAFDFHGEYTDSKIASVVSGARVIDAMDGLPFNPLSVDSPSSGTTVRPERVVWEVAEIFSQIFSLGIQQRRLLKRTIEEAFGSRIVDGEVRSGAEPAPSFSDIRDHLLNKEPQSRVAQTLLSRIEPVLEFDVFDEEGSLEDLLRQSLTVVDLSRLFNDEHRLVVARFLLRRIYQRMALTGETQDLRQAVVLDEAHRLPFDTALLKLLKESRKYGIAILLSSQEPEDFPRTALEIPSTTIVLQQGPSGARTMANALSHQDLDNLEQRLRTLDVGEAFVSSDHHNPATRTRLLLFHERLKNGWIGETKLYFLVKQRFPEAIRRASPSWLGRQHLDVYVPTEDVAFEYQGRQHYHPIERFEEQDGEKRAKCEEVGVTLVEWRYDEPMRAEELDRKLAHADADRAIDQSLKVIR